MNNINQTQAPILISENQQRHRDLMQLGRSTFAAIQPLKETYLKTKLGPFDNQAYQRIISGGIGSIEDKLITDVTARYEALNLRSETMKNEILTDAYGIIEQLKTAVERLKQKAEGSTVPSFPLNLITIDEEGEPKITKQAEDYLMELYCRTYLRTPDEVSIYNKLEAAASAINELWAEVKENGTQQIPVTAGLPAQFGLLVHCFKTDDKGALAVQPYMASNIVNRYQRNIGKFM